MSKQMTSSLFIAIFTLAAFNLSAGGRSSKMRKAGYTGAATIALVIVGKTLYAQHKTHTAKAKAQAEARQVTIMPQFHLGMLGDTFTCDSNEHSPLYGSIINKDNAVTGLAIRKIEGSGFYIGNHCPVFVPQPDNTFILGVIRRFPDARVVTVDCGEQSRTVDYQDLYVSTTGYDRNKKFFALEEDSYLKNCLVCCNDSNIVCLTDMAQEKLQPDRLKQQKSAKMLSRGL